MVVTINKLVSAEGEELRESMKVHENPTPALVQEKYSAVAWDDSTLCRLTHPTLTAMSHNIVAYGSEVAHRLFDLLEGARPEAHLYSTPQLVVRESSGPPPAN